MKTFYKLRYFIIVLLNIFFWGCGYTPNEEEIEGVMDLKSPTVLEVTAIDTSIKDSTPDYTYSSSENGTTTYGGSCSSNSTLTTIGNNTITLASPTLDNLSDATYSDCTITVTDWALNESSALSITEFTVDVLDPTASLTTATITTSENALIQSTEVGTGYLVKSSISVDNISDITSAADNQSNSVAISSANTNTSISALGLSAGTFKGYALDNASNISTASTNSVTVMLDYALDFNGSSDNASASGATTEIDNSDNLPLSVSAWVYPADNSTSQQVFGFFRNSPFASGPSVWYGDTDNRFQYYDQAVSQVASSDSAYQNWHHIVFAIGSNRSGVLYVNGSSVGTFSSAYNSGNLDMFSIGMDYDDNSNTAGNASNFFSGKIDEIAIWSDKLTANEVVAIYNGGKMLSVLSNSGNYNSSGNLKAYYRFNTGSGTTLQDNTSNSNAGSTDGGPDWVPGFISK